MDQQSLKSTDRSELFKDIFGNFSSVLFMFTTLDEDDEFIKDYEHLNNVLLSMLSKIVKRVYVKSEDNDEELC